jgi:putative phosphoesterase
MRIAVFADIHGSLPALEAALAETEREGVDRYIVAGDMLAGPNPAEVMQRLRLLKCWMIRGNHENYLLRYFNGSAPGYWYSSKQWAWMHWNYQRLDKDTLDFISRLPEQRSLHFPGTEPIRVVHGSPRNNSELVFPDEDISLLDCALSQVTEPVLIFGHTHRQWKLNRRGKLAFNPGGLSGIFSGSPAAGMRS